MRVLIFLCLFALCAFAENASAVTCKTDVPSSTRSIANMTIPRDAPVGAIIGYYFTSGITPFSCDSSAPDLKSQEFGIKAYGNYVMTMDNRRIYSTNRPGIGYSVYAVNSACYSKSVTVSGSGTLGGDVNTALICSNPTGSLTSGFTSTPGFIFYKTGPVTPGTVNATRIGAFVLRNDQTTYLTESTFGFTPFAVTSSGCSISNVNNIFNVDMGSVKKTEFSGIGSSPASSNTRDININLACDAGTKVSMQVDGNVINAANGILKLNNDTGAATGVGVQLLYNNSPLTLSSPVFIGTASTTMNIQLQSRYYQTQAEVKSGVANSVATFTMTY
ncbi:fimbrial protein, partial [Escherichia coli]|nr:fimbrial protein [Escherichia coli]